MQRSISNVEGVSCAVNIKILTENKIEEGIYSSKGGGLIEDYMTVTILSYLLMGKNKYLASTYKTGDELTLSDINNLNSATISINFEHTNTGHLGGFYMCNKVGKFYDDEYGVIDFNWIRYLNYICF